MRRNSSPNFATGIGIRRKIASFLRLKKFNIPQRVCPHFFSSQKYRSFVSRFSIPVAKSGLFNNKGQVFPYYLSMIIVLIISWGMLINISRLVYERMMVQNAADNAALSMSTYHARSLNLLMEINVMLARYCYTGLPTVNPLLKSILYKDNEKMDVKKINEWEKLTGLTGIYPLPVCGGSGGNYGCCTIGAVIPQVTGLLLEGVGNSIDKVAALSDIVGGSALCGYGTTIAGSEKLEIGARAMYWFFMSMTDAEMGTQVMISRLNATNSWQLARTIAKRQDKNSKGEFCGADSVISFNMPSLNWGFIRNEEKLNIYGMQHYYGSIPAVPPFYAGNHGHVVVPYIMETVKNTWYFFDPEEFNKRKVTVLATKDANSSEDYPFMKNYFGIGWPKIQATASAGSYNPSNEGNGFIQSPQNRRSDKLWQVIESYNKGKEYGGWKAHLVPTGLPLSNH